MRSSCYQLQSRSLHLRSCEGSVEGRMGSGELDTFPFPSFSPSLGSLDVADRPRLGCKQVDYITEKLLEVTEFPEGREQTKSELGSWEGMDQWNAQRVMDCQVLCEFGSSITSLKRVPRAVSDSQVYSCLGRHGLVASGQRREALRSKSARSRTQGWFDYVLVVSRSPSPSPSLYRSGADSRVCASTMQDWTGPEDDLHSQGSTRRSIHFLPRLQRMGVRFTNHRFVLSS